MALTDTFVRNAKSERSLIADGVDPAKVKREGNQERVFAARKPSNWWRACGLKRLPLTAPPARARRSLVGLRTTSFPTWTPARIDPEAAGRPSVCAADGQRKRSGRASTQIAGTTEHDECRRCGKPNSTNTTPKATLWIPAI